MSRTYSSLTEEKTFANVDSAIESARNYLLQIQKEDGHWCGELQGDTILESEYILAMYFLGYEKEERVQKAGEYIRTQVLPDGGWAIYPGGPPDVSASVKAYFTLKLLGEDIDSALMKNSRQVIRQLGGVAAVNSFTRIYLAIFGQFPWEECPAVPPEITLLPNWFPINLYEMSYWSRCIVVPLSVIWATKPRFTVPKELSISELWIENLKPPAAKNLWKL